LNFIKHEFEKRLGKKAKFVFVCSKKEKKCFPFVQKFWKVKTNQKEVPKLQILIKTFRAEP